MSLVWVKTNSRCVLHIYLQPCDLALELTSRFHLFGRLIINDGSHTATCQNKSLKTVRVEPWSVWTFNCMFELSLEEETDVEEQPVAWRLEMNASEWKVLSYSVAMSVIGQCQISAILLNNQNAKFNNGFT